MGTTVTTGPTTTAGGAATPQLGVRKLSGAEIKAKIAANRSKRLAISEAMKREAGVAEHTVWQQESGLAFIGTGRIASPEGRNMRQLWTVAHECGHIFLHNSGPGFHFASHVKELEAESYAHQAFREHGMQLPAELSNWGRAYVGSWVAKDRAAGIPIDPRAEAYASGKRSPYEPLRMVPATWKLHKALLPPAPVERPAPASPAPPVRVQRPIATARAPVTARPPAKPPRPGMPRWRIEMKILPALLVTSFAYGSLLTDFALRLVHHWLYSLPHIFYDRYGGVHLGPMLQHMFVGGLLMACLATMYRTLRAY